MPALNILNPMLPRHPRCILPLLLLLFSYTNKSSAQVCNNLSEVSLDETCTLVVTPEMVLEGSYNYANYTVALQTQAGVPVPNLLTVAFLGMTLVATVTDTTMGNSCWGQIKIEDHWAPEIVCNELQVYCVLPGFSPTYLNTLMGLSGAFPEALDNCGPVELSYSDIWEQLNCSDSLDRSARILRSWSATDYSGNVSTCLQVLHVQRIHLADLSFPPTVQLDCTQADTSAANTGEPFFTAWGHDFAVAPNAALCGLQIMYKDQYLPQCPGAYNILRTWTGLDDCPQGPSSLQQLQLIQVLDTHGPQLNCPNNLTVNANPFTCYSNFDLPDIVLSDQCGWVTDFSAQWVVDSTAHTLTGSLEDFQGNNYWSSDTLGVLGIAQGLPIGETSMHYLASDLCGNSSMCSFKIYVVDGVKPIVACDAVTQVTIGGTGASLVDAHTFDDGSYDNCSSVDFKVRRFLGGGCQPDSMFFDSLMVCCADVGDTLNVVLRVYDFTPQAGPVSLTYGLEHSNECLIKVIVKDKLKPVCIPPENVEVQCSLFDPSLGEYGFAVGDDNCCLDTVMLSGVNLNQFDTLCNRGTIVRHFIVVDCHGLSSTCAQQIIVHYEQSYWIHFPDDIVINDCDTTGAYGPGPELFGIDCELVAISHTDEVFESAPDACYKIKRTWRIINWCTYNPNSPFVVVPNPNPSGDLNSSLNLLGPVVAPPGNTPAATVVTLSPDDLVPTDFSQFWQQNSNGYEYAQIINIRDDMPPEIRSCPLIFPLIFCDHSTNNPQLWNAPQWVSPSMPSVHDLCEMPVDMAVTGRDLCSGSNVDIRYLLFLDLDGDDVTETVVSSTNPPEYGKIHYNNINTYNYEGGEIREFDQRPVPPDQKYGFAIDFQDFYQKTAKFRWHSAAAPGVFVKPELPFGHHKIRWIVSDACGNETFCEYDMTIQDCGSPVVVCLDGLSVNIQASSTVELYANDFLLYMSDNCTPQNLLDISIVRSDQSAGVFPTTNNQANTTVAFSCADQGEQMVQLWVRDNAGNTSFCETNVQVQDNLGACSNNYPLSVAGHLLTEDEVGIQEALISLHGWHPQTDSLFGQVSSNNFGAYVFNNVLPYGANFDIMPYKNDNLLNGVTTYDIVLINRHLLGQQPLDSPYKMIAADINRSNSITSFDAVELRKLILGLYSEFPNNTSWRFVDGGYVFPNPANPFQAPIPEQHSGGDLQNSLDEVDFVGVKIGDVNMSALPNTILGSGVERSSRAIGLMIPDAVLQKGDDVVVDVSSEMPLEALQFTLAFSQLEFVEIEPLAGLEMDAFAVNPGAIVFAWASSGEVQKIVFRLHFKAKSAGALHEMLQLSGSVCPSLAYSLGGVRHEPELHFVQGEQILVTTPVFELYQNTPNPFDQQTRISFYLPQATQASLRFVDETGRLIYQWSASCPQGYNIVEMQKSQLPVKGWIYYHLETPQHTAVRKMLITGE